MRNYLKDSAENSGLQNISSLLTTGVAAGVTIASITKRDEKVGALIGGGSSLLLSGLLLWFKED